MSDLYFYEDIPICFDVDKCNCSDFVLDVKILYELWGYKFNSLEDLLKQVCPELHEKYNTAYEKIKAHLRSFQVCKIKNFNVKDAIPAKILSNFKAIKKECVFFLFEKIDNDELINFYINHFYDVVRTLQNISLQKVKINTQILNNFNNHYAFNVKQIVKDDFVDLKFNYVGAKNGRLTCKKNSLPIFTMPTNMREVVSVEDDFELVQMDFKSFQPRIAIFSTDDEILKDQFRKVEDIYSVFDGNREENKLAFLTWMFVENPSNLEFESKTFALLELREKLHKQVLEKGYITNSFGRPLFFSKEEKDNKIFQNFIASNESDAIFSIIVKLHKALENKKSKIAFPFHDAIFFKIHKSEKHFIKKIQEYLQNFYINKIFYSKYPVEVKIGKNLGNLEKN